MSRLAKTSWVVYAKKPFREVLHVLRYLGRYTHRVAIANSRLVDVTDEAIVFRTKSGRTKVLTPVEFLRRFIQHVLPNGLHKIRHYGLYAGASEEAHAAACNSLAYTPPVRGETTVSWSVLLQRVTGRDIERCPKCGGPLVRVAVARALARAPPSRAA
ncbi:transposase [Pendulispora brunnea]|uniref:IS91 family transposase n=1 Tax=Pendulispora brunnea TaxID=2905690 RepID=UPI00374E1582